MYNLILCILLCLFFQSIRFVSNGDMSWYLAEFGQMASVSIFVWYAISITPWKRINERCVLSLALIWQISDCACYWIWYCYPDAMFFSWYFQVLCMAGWFGWILSRRPLRYSDPVSKGNIHICIGKPTKIRGSLASVVGLPAGSIAIYADGKIWSYKWGSKVFLSRTVSSEVVNKHHTIIDTGVKITSDNGHIMGTLKSLIGNPARRRETCFLRMNCVYTLKPVLSLLGKKYEPSGLSYLPSVYARMIAND